MATKSNPRDKILKALTGSENKARVALTEMFVDQIFAQPMRSVVDVNHAVETILITMDGPNVQRIVDRSILPGIERHKARYAGKTLTMGAAMDGASRSRFEKLIVESQPPRAAWMKDAVDARVIRQLFAPVIQDVLVGFAKRLPVIGNVNADDARAKIPSGLGAQLFARVEKRAERFVEVGKAALGSVSAEVEQKIQGVAREFSQNATSEIKHAIEARMKSTEGRELTGQIKRDVLRRYLDTPIETLNQDMESQPISQLIALLPALGTHNRNREFVRDLLREEIQAAVDSISGMTIGEILEEAKLLEHIRTLLVSQGEQRSREVFESKEFSAWLDDVLA